MRTGAWEHCIGRGVNKSPIGILAGFLLSSMEWRMNEWKKHGDALWP
jgi:hypothetical protein